MLFFKNTCILANLLNKASCTMFFLIEIWYTYVSSASSKTYPISYMTHAFYSLEVGTAEWQMSLYVCV